MNDTKIRPELREWILATTRAGHGPNEVVRLMKNAGYALPLSRRIIAKVLNIPMSALSADIDKPGAPGLRTKHPTAPQQMVGEHAVRVALSVEKPAIRLLENLLTAQECEDLIGQAEPRLQRSLTVAEDGKHQTDTRRSSLGMFFRIGETPLVDRIEQRIANLLQIPINHGEGLQILHYLPGQEYEPHFDWFDPTQPGFAAVTERGGQRIASVVIYLNTPQEGGGTGFPAIGLTVTALRGSAVYFAYEGGDLASLHAGLPVIQGQKWIATKWLRERPYQG